MLALLALLGWACAALAVVWVWRVMQRRHRREHEREHGRLPDPDVSPWWC